MFRVFGFKDEGVQAFELNVHLSHSYLPFLTYIKARPAFFFYKRVG